MTVAAAVLAAGGGTRYQGSSHKLRASFRSRPVLSWVLEAVSQAGFDQVYVVVGAEPVDDLVAPWAEACPGRVTVVANPRWADGQASSLTAAVEAAGADGHEAVVVGLGDQPLVPASAWRAVGAAAGLIVVATFDGDRRPPVKLSHQVWDRLPTTGDAGARALMRQQPELVSEIPCTGNPADIDTVEDLRRWS